MSVPFLFLEALQCLLDIHTQLLQPRDPLCPNPLYLYPASKAGSPYFAEPCLHTCQDTLCTLQQLVARLLQQPHKQDRVFLLMAISEPVRLDSHVSLRLKDAYCSLRRRCSLNASQRQRMRKVEEREVEMVIMVFSRPLLYLQTESRVRGSGP